MDRELTPIINSSKPFPYFRNPLAYLLSLFAGIFPNYSNAHYDPNEIDVSGRSFYFENDELYAPQNEDRDYTMGLAAAVSGKNVVELPIVNWLQPTMDWITDKSNFLYPTDFSGNIFHTAALNDTAFTPDNLAAKQPVIGDRPYANLLYISLNETRPNNKFFPRQAISNTVVLGALGLDVGKAFQRWLHQEVGATVPEGWDNQISDGGEITGLINHTRKYLLISSENPYLPEPSLQVGAEIGYYTDVFTRLNFRWGRLGSPWYLTDLNSLRYGAFMQPLMASKSHQEPISDLYFYTGIGARYFVYNALLQGQIRDNPYDVPASNLERFVVEGTAGVAIQISQFILRYEVGYRSSEIKDGIGAKEHYFGGIHVLWKSKN